MCTDNKDAGLWERLQARPKWLRGRFFQTPLNFSLFLQREVKAMKTIRDLLGPEAAMRAPAGSPQTVTIMTEFFRGEL